MKQINIQFSRVHPDAKIPAYQTPGSAAFDLAIVEDITIEPGQIVLARSGLVIKTPEDHVLLIAPRSSSPRKKGLGMPHSIGIIDSDYAGPEDEILLQIQNITEEPVQLQKGDRVAQGMFIPISKATFHEVEHMEHENRGGFGSTGS